MTPVERVTRTPGIPQDGRLSTSTPDVNHGLRGRRNELIGRPLEERMYMSGTTCGERRSCVREAVSKNTGFARGDHLLGTPVEPREIHDYDVERRGKDSEEPS